MKTENIETLEALLAGSCILLNDAAAIQKKLRIPPEKEVFRAITEALLRCWDARELLYKERPELKPELITHAEQYPEVEEAYVNTIEEAVVFEQTGQLGEAIEVYQRFLQTGQADLTGQ